MQWTKIPTNILINRLSDQEIVSIVKYQLLWADLEYQPDDKTALRYLTGKQLSIVKQYLNAIETQVKRDIHSSETNRNNRKLNYLKNKEKNENVSITLPITVSNNVERQIRIDNIKEKIYKKENNDLFGNQIENQIEKRFVKPTVDEIRVYCEERKNKVNADDFFDFYESKGWKIGKSPMKDWKASVRLWERKRNGNDIPEVANSKIPAEVYIDSGQFYLDNTFAEFSDMTDEQCNSCAKWLFDKFRFQTLSREKFVKIARGFKK